MGIYLRSRSLKNPGTSVLLEIKIESGARVLYASAVVHYVTGNKGEGVPGMGFKFITLDAVSRRFLESAAAAMPHVRSDEPPVPRNVGPIDTSPDAIPPEPPPASQAQAALPSELAGRLLVQGDAKVVKAPPFEPAPEPPRTGPIIGIDLGTTNSCAAIVRDGKPMLLSWKDGQALVPSMVALTPRGQLVVGAAAKQQLTTNPKWVVYGFKRLIGRPIDGPRCASCSSASPTRWWPPRTASARCSWAIAPTGSRSSRRCCCASSSNSPSIGWASRCTAR